MVPGSAREVPPWILAGPVLMRLAAVVRQLGRTFGVRSGLRASPRGRVDWTEYARRGLPSGRWQQFDCCWPELQRDPWMTSTLRWTIEQIVSDLEKAAGSPAAAKLRELALQLLRVLGAGERRRPESGELDRRTARLEGAVMKEALEGVAWVAEERGLGGARVLDGVAWSLGADALWEAWVESLVKDVSTRLGGRVAGHAFARRSLRWSGTPSTLTSLEPDVGMLLGDRAVYFDAKYKFHLQHFRWRSWSQQTEATREAHRADVHQALAYAALSDATNVDTVLVYPLPGEASEPIHSVASIPSGRRGVRLLLLGLPFGCVSQQHRRATLAVVEGLIRDTAGP